MENLLDSEVVSHYMVTFSDRERGKPAKHGSGYARWAFNFLFALITDSVTPGLQHVDCNYSCAYVTIYTEGDVEGHGLTFTIGRGNEIGKWKAIG
jgi:hypothetical protein